MSFRGQRRRANGETMGNLADQHSFNPDPIVRAQVQHAIFPFNPGLVTLWMHVDTLDPIIKISSSTFTDDVFVLDGRELYYVPNSAPAFLAEFVGFRAGEFFASLREPVPSNVVLGEN